MQGKWLPQKAEKLVLRWTQRAAWALLLTGTMLLLCACGKEKDIWEPDDTGLVPMEVPGDTGQSEEDGEAAARIYVHVCGAVIAPDVYALPEGSRVYEAVQMAGGFADDADAEQVNLAVTLSDGQKVRVPRKGEQLSEAQMPGESGTGAAGDGSSGGAGVVNINTAGKEVLMTLNGIGSTRAEAIIQYRESHGAFQSTRDLLKVNGIKEKTYEKIRGQISIE